MPWITCIHHKNLNTDDTLHTFSPGAACPVLPPSIPHRGQHAINNIVSCENCSSLQNNPAVPSGPFCCLCKTMMQVDTCLLMYIKRQHILVVRSLYLGSYLPWYPKSFESRRIVVLQFTTPQSNTFTVVSYIGPQGWIHVRFSGYPQKINLHIINPDGIHLQSWCLSSTTTSDLSSMNQV